MSLSHIRAPLLARLALWLFLVSVVTVSAAVSAPFIAFTPSQSVATEEDLLAAIRNDSIRAVRLPVNLRLTATAWPAAPVVRSSSFKIVGDPFYPILDLSFLESKIQLQPGVVFTFKQVELRNTRQRSGYEVDIFSASPNATVRYESMVYHCFSCVPVDTLFEAMLSGPPATLPQQMEKGSWCRTQPALAACYTTGVINITSASALLPVSGYQNAGSGGGYTLEGYHVIFVCVDPTTDECGVMQGYDYCVRNRVQEVYASDRTWDILASLVGAGNESSRAAGRAVTIGAAVGGSVGGLLALLAGAAVLLTMYRGRCRALAKGPAVSLARKTDSGDGAASVQVHVVPSDDPGDHASPDAGLPSTNAAASALGGGAPAPECRAAQSSNSKSGSGSTAMGAGGLLLPQQQQPLRHDAVLGSRNQVGTATASLSYGHVSLPMSSLEASGPRDVVSASLPVAALGDGTTVSVAGVTIDLSNAVGSGSFGKVFRGTWRGRPVAVKVLHYSSELCRAVHSEVTLSQRLRHPNVVASLYFAQVLPGGRVGLHTCSSSSPSAPSSADAVSEVASPQPPQQQAYDATGGLAPHLGGLGASPAALAVGARPKPVTAGRYTRFIDSAVDPSETGGASIVGLSLGSGFGPPPAPIPPGGGSRQATMQAELRPSSEGAAAGGVITECGVAATAVKHAVLYLSSDAVSGSSPSGPPPAQVPPGLHTGGKEGVGSEAAAAEGENRDRHCGTRGGVQDDRAAFAPPPPGASGRSLQPPPGFPSAPNGSAADDDAVPCQAPPHGAPEGSQAPPAAQLQVGPASSVAQPPGGGAAAASGAAAAAAVPPGAALPLQALWLATNAQPAEGGSHGFLVMELCEGGSLSAWRSTQWREPGQLPDMLVLVRLALDISYGMCYIHSVGVCHGDLKLANVLLARAPAASEAGPGASLARSLGVPDPLSGWAAKLCDFGLSRVLVGDRTHVSTRPYGTPTHMAPELWKQGHVSQPGDVYAFGILLWELATGERPYKGLSAANILHTVLLSGGRPPLPHWLPPVYARLVAQCWAQEPKQRPTFSDALRSLEAMLVEPAALAGR